MPSIDDQALDQHIRATETQAKAQVCAHHVSGFADEFERRFQAWRQAHTDLLNRGAAVAQARGLSGPQPPGIEWFAQAQAQVVKDMPPDVRQQRCNDLLALYRVRPLR
jgi:hypothetical protein